jgi:hypothetical protein
VLSKKTKAGDRDADREETGQMKRGGNGLRFAACRIRQS